ncbi:MAG: RagB/SusD family nutrient uptake outer membrane protein [Parafilimonas sp.]
MKINKRSITLIAVLVVIIPLAFIPLACKKGFLNQTNTFQTPADGAFQKSSDVIELINSIYDTYQNSDLLKKSMWYWANFESHDFYNWGGDVVWNNYQIPSNFGAILTLWNQSYLGIARANYALAEIPDALDKGILDQDLANRLTGEAYFLRGSFYYYLASSFGGVPLELKTGSDGLTPRSSRDSVFTQVVSDMQNAEKLLLSKKDLQPGDLGRATKGAAYGYEGAAQMWLQNYQGALDAFNNPELTNNYSLLSSFADVNEYDHQNNDESLFEVQFSATGTTQDWGGSWNPPGGEVAWIDSFDWPVEITQQGYTYGNPALWNSYQQGDKRKYLTIVGPGDSLVSPGIVRVVGGIKGYIPVVQGFATGDPEYTGDDGKIINTVGTVTRPWYSSSSDRSGYFCAKKWRDYNLTGNYGPQKIFGDQNQILLRYAEVLLDRAECKVRTGDVPGAMADLKLVRDRAWGGTAPAIMQDSANFDGTKGVPITDPLQMVLSEYRHELAGEYSVFYDLCRAGTSTAVDFVNKANGTVSGSYNPVPNPAPGPTHDGKQHGLYNTALTPDDCLMPIPQTAKGLNPNLTQNPGY